MESWGEHWGIFLGFRHQGAYARRPVPPYHFLIHSAPYALTYWGIGGAGRIPLIAVPREKRIMADFSL
jgi:hypothetical protein